MMDDNDFIARVCSFDLETNEQGEIFAFGAVFQDKVFHHQAPVDIQQVLKAFDHFAADADFLLGHNLIRHDLPVCQALNSNLSWYQKPVIDTLFLSPLAFPENPYHRLVKNYKLVRDSLNDPVADSRLALSLFRDQWQALTTQQQETGLLSFYHYAFSGRPEFSGLQAVLLAMGAEAVKAGAAFDLFKRLTDGKVCKTAVNKVILSYLPNPALRPALAYCLAWLRVAGGNSVLPAWVREQFTEVAPAIRQLRESSCQSPDCQYCRDIHNPVTQLQRYFGYPAFRSKPENATGGSLQQDIVQAAMQDHSVFAVLPTGGGKSLCFQLPALVRYQRRGALTIVISPLQALMKDQVDNLRNKTGAPSAAALYGALTGPERGEVIKAIQMGDIALLYVSPEQLRNQGFRQAIEHREIGCWVFDEAHCLSKWGHDFRPDYLYVARFIKECAARQHALLPPVQCFTATAKQDVKQEILDYFKANLGLELQCFEGGVERQNLHFEVQTVNSVDKFPRISQLLQQRLKPHQSEDAGSAIVYCSSRKQTEKIAEFLRQQDWPVHAFHAGLNPAEKKHIQDSFLQGDIQVITATNAFGMGIDKDDVRVVIHADIPGSLENYLQEAGRAGRDQQDAECILLFDENDIDRQFKLSALSQVNKRDIAQILRGLRRSKRDDAGNIVITAGELLQNEMVDTSFEADDNNATTKVITAISWLERAGFIQRNENKTQVFQGRPLVKNPQEAEQKIAQLGLSARQKKRWLAILDALFNAESDEGFSADELALLSEFAESDEEKNQQHQISASQRVIRTLYDMSQAGIIQKNMLLTAFVRYKSKNASTKLLSTLCQLERALLELLQEQAPDAEQGEWQVLSIRHLNQHLLDSGFDNCCPDTVQLLLISMSKDGQGLAGGQGSLYLRHGGLDQYRVRLNRSWSVIREIVRRRQAVAHIILQAVLQKIPADVRERVDVLVEFSLEYLVEALQGDMELSASIKDPLAAVERGLNFLHEQKIITLQKGLAVFRQAMTIQVLPEAKGRRYNNGDYAPLEQHYSERIFQIHVMNEYAQKGLEAIGQAIGLVVAYFSQDKTDFVKQYFSDRKELLTQATSQQSFQKIVTDLNNPLQQTLVASEEDDNLLILAGPGSGKTRVVVHRCAYLLRVKQVPARSILMLCFNRNAATELRQRLFDLVGPEARSVAIHTYHGLSLRLSGHTIENPLQVGETENNQPFSVMLQEAIDLLTGKRDSLNVDGDEMRERLLAGYRFILVDEYQDIDTLQYQLISALAGRHQDEETRLSILAVGDDDQNIYQFRGANVGFIRQFEQDYQAKKHYLVENYRSTGHIIQAANQVIRHNRDRMKQEYPIRINQGRRTLPAGGRWEKLDPVAKGRVQILSCADEMGQAQAVVHELLRLKQLDNSLGWRQCAVLSPEWRLLNLARAVLEAHAIPLSQILPKDKQFSPWRIRENMMLLNAIQQAPKTLTRASEWLDFVTQKLPANNWRQQLQTVLHTWQMETNDAETSTQQLLEYLYETLSEQWQESRLGHGVFLSTIHSVKGMEFKHVFILDGAWRHPASEEQRRLFYVAMTRAKETLCLLQRGDQHNPYLAALSGDFIVHRQGGDDLGAERASEYKQYSLLGLRDFDLSYAATFPQHAPIHAALRQLTTGDCVTLKEENNRVYIMKGTVKLAALSKTARQNWCNKLDKIQQLKVIAIITRYRRDSDEAYQSRCKVEQWDVPILEVMYADDPCRHFV